MAESEIMAVLEHQPFMSEDKIGDLVRALVSTPSCNGVDAEGTIARVIAGMLEESGVEPTLVPLDEGLPDRYSVGAVLEGSSDGASLVLNGHIDTVPVGDLGAWGADPFAGVIKDGFLYGRGAADMKGGLAAQILCVRCLVALKAELRGRVVLHFAAGEEKGEGGTSSLLREGFGGDFGITVEPTGLDLGLVMPGMAAYRLRVGGRSSHAGRADLGLNPISGLVPLLEGVSRYDRELGNTARPRGSAAAACTVTMIHAGIEQSSIPDECEVILDRRLLPGESMQSALAELREIVAAAASCADERYRWSIEPLLGFDPCAIASDHPLARAVREAAQAATGRQVQDVATTFASDVTKLAHEGRMDALQFGPGDIAVAHAPDEHVSLDDVRSAAIVFTLTVLNLLGAE